MSTWRGGPTEPPGRPGIDESNQTQVQLVLAQRDLTISTLRNRVKDLTETLKHETEDLRRSVQDKNWQLSILAEMIERSGIEFVPYNVAEAVALNAARTFLEVQRNKIIERVESTLGKVIKEEKHNDDD